MFINKELKKRILEAHGIEHKEVGGNVFDCEVYTINGVCGSLWVNITEMDKNALYNWLGY